MFHADIVAKRIRTLEKNFGVKLYQYSVDESRYVSEVQLESKRNPKTGKLENLTLDEQLFCQNEVLVSRADFRYWFERYPKIVLDNATGESGHPQLWTSQEIMLRRLAERELDMHQKFDAGHRKFDGNRWYVHKARQMGLSSICQGINIHAVNFYAGTNSLVGSTNLPKTQELHRDYGRMMWASMPDWMRVPAFKDHQEQGLVLANGSKVVLQHSEQETGFGQGAKWHRSHLTEIASWKETGTRNNVVDHIDNHYEPAVSRSIKSAAFLESTSQGMDNYWHRNTERARAKKLGWWWYLFIPWWLIPDLYIEETVPSDWNPSPKTLEEEEIIISASPEFNDGHTYRPSLEQMYWWEQRYQAASEKGLLNEFFKNYPSIPEESFTHSGRSSFPYEVLVQCESRVREPYAYYELVTPELQSARVRTERELDPRTKLYTDPPKPIEYAGETVLVPINTTEEERYDPLGLILAWESPKEVAPFDVYGGVDTTDGIENWTRYFRKKGEEDINNAAISLIRSGASRDTDIIEYAAPVTFKPLAKIYNAIARTWVGRNSMDGQVPTIVELTGIGKAFQDELLTAYDFFAFYQNFNFTGGEWVETNQYGWKPSPAAVRHMWALFKSRVTEGGFITRSRHLVREMRSCTDDQIYVSGMTRGKAPKTGGRHDDRVYSRAFAVWYANSFSTDARPERSLPKINVEGKKKLKLHQMDFDSPEGREQYIADWEERVFGR